MTKNWYNVKSTMHFLKIRSDELRAIQANAFDHFAFMYLMLLEIYAKHLTIHVDAFVGLQHIRIIEFEGITARFPAGIFDSNATTIMEIKFYAWPNDVSMNDMFNHLQLRMLWVLGIRDVAEPQTKFRFLAAVNFTSFRRIEILELTRCGIEVIDEHTFDLVGQSLIYITLIGNRIKSVRLEMFRRFFESKATRTLSIQVSRDYLPCTCSLLEMAYLASMYIDCTHPIGFNWTLCITPRGVNIAKLCLDPSATPTFYIYDIRLTYENDSIGIQANITNRFRVILARLNAMDRRNCNARASNTSSVCSNVNKFVDHLNLSHFDQLRDAEFILITAIPLLYNHGARPMYSSTIRYKIPVAQNQFLDNSILIGIATIFIGIIVGFVCGLGKECISMGLKNRRKDVEMEKKSDENLGDRPSPYEYFRPTASIMNRTTHLNNYDETVHPQNYIELIDTGYVNILKEQYNEARVAAFDT